MQRLALWGLVAAAAASTGSAFVVPCLTPSVSVSRSIDRMVAVWAVKSVFAWACRTPMQLPRGGGDAAMTSTSIYGMSH